MIKDFETIKKQLRDLSGVINGFKSEAVQLKVVDLLFQRMGIEAATPETTAAADSPKKRRATRKKASSNADGEKTPKKARTSKGGRPGPGAMVTQLIGGGFFRKPKTIQNIIDHCQSESAYTYKSNELSVTMTRSLRSNTLKRKKNADNQFEYFTN